MELTGEMKRKMTDVELDKSYIPHQEKLPVVAYQLIKSLISFIVAQHNNNKELTKEVRELKGRVA
ncbi:MAG: hypothetical protein GQ553_02005 [Nitrosomonadaceae bacterium]|nr:hypothetical protein [Nitrosomonadaceae bacterium]